MQTQFTMAQDASIATEDVPGIVDYWAEVQAGHPAIEFVEDDGSKRSLSYGELQNQSLAVAQRLRGCCAAGDRVILMLGPGTEFVVGFMGCLYAGVIAVPASEPKPRRLNNRLARLVEDCGPSAVLTNRSIAGRIVPAEVCPSLADVPWITIDSQAGLASRHLTGERVDRAAPSAFLDRADPAEAKERIAFLQYTSGSTSDPLGVMVTHGNLLHNLEMIRLSFGLEFNTRQDESLRGVFWLPPYHDMGLIGGILTPLYVGGTAVLMSPATFMKRPLDWLRLITQERAIISGAPNFAYDLCAQRGRGEQLDDLDLRSWRTAFCGAEPIRAETIDQFYDVFQTVGFRRDSFYPCYGLAEAVLLVTGSQTRCEPVIKFVDRRALETRRLVVADEADAGSSDPADRLVRVVGCGQPCLDGELVIVNPQTRTLAEAGEVGEIWYRGSNVAAGYWNAPAKTAAVFQACLADAPRQPFLRTGDTGFILDEQLFITGRTKEMLVIRGRNLYPQDIEATVRASAVGKINGVAAFAIDEVSAGEGLAVAFEVERHVEREAYAPLIQLVRQQLAAVHEVAPQAIIVVRPFGLPRTTSGKMQRLLTKHLYRKQELRILESWTAGLPPPTQPPAADLGSVNARESAARSRRSQLKRGTAPRPSIAADQVERWLCQRLAVYGNLAVEEVSPDRPLAEFGLDSMAALQLVGEIEERYRISLNPIAMWNYPTARHLANHLAQQTSSGGDTSATRSLDFASNRYEAILAEIETLDEAEVLWRLEQIQ